MPPSSSDHFILQGKGQRAVACESLQFAAAKTGQSAKTPGTWRDPLFPALWCGSKTTVFVRLHTCKPYQSLCLQACTASGARRINVHTCMWHIHICRRPAQACSSFIRFVLLLSHTLSQPACLVPATNNMAHKYLFYFLIRAGRASPGAHLQGPPPVALGPHYMARAPQQQMGMVPSQGPAIYNYNPSQYG